MTYSEAEEFVINHSDLNAKPFSIRNTDISGFVLALIISPPDRSSEVITAWNNNYRDNKKVLDEMGVLDNSDLEVVVLGYSNGSILPFEYNFFLKHIN